jgi:hypothetical protein
VRGAELVTGVHAPSFPAEPLAVKQARAGEVDQGAGLAELPDRLLVQVLRGLARAEQRP